MVDRYLSHLLGKWLYGIKAIFSAFRWLEKKQQDRHRGVLMGRKLKTSKFLPGHIWFSTSVQMGAFEIWALAHRCPPAQPTPNCTSHSPSSEFYFQVAIFIFNYILYPYLLSSETTAKGNIYIPLQAKLL